MATKIWLGNAGAVLLCVVSLGCSRGERRDQLLAKGNRFFQQNKLADASLIYRKALQADPRFGEAYYRLGLTEIRLQHVKTARAALSKAVELMPENTDAWVQLGEVYLISYQADRSRVAYEQLESIANRILDRTPDSFAGLRLKGYLAVADLKPGLAVEFFSKANVIRPLVPDVAAALAQSLLQAGRGDEGESISKQLIALHPHFGPIYDVLYGYYLRTARTQDAEQILIAKSKSNPTSDFALLQLAEHYVGQHRQQDAERVIRGMVADAKTYPGGHLAAAEFYRKTGQFDRVVRELEAGAAAKPAEKSAYEKEIVDALLQSGEKQQAVERLNRLINEFPADHELKATRASLLVDSSTMRERSLARANLQQLLELAPGNLTLRYELGRAYAGENRYAEARLQLETVAAAQPGNVLARIGLAELSSRTGDFPECLRWAEDALKIRPDLHNAHLLKATALAGLGRLDPARAEYEALISQNPGYREAKLQLGLLDLMQKRYSAAEKRFRENYDPARGDFRALKGLVELYTVQGRADQAMALLQKETALYPGIPELSAIAAAWSARVGKWDMAVREYERVNAKRPDDAEILIALGDAYQRLGELPKATAAFERAGTLQPGNWHIPLLLGYVHQLSGQTQTAEADYKKSLQLNPDEPQTLNNLAFLIAERGRDLDQALALAKKASAGGGGPAAADTIGWIYLKQGELDSAERVFAGLVKNNPEDGILRYHLGLVLHRKGARPDARRELQAALRAGLPQGEREIVVQLLSQE